MKQLDKTMIQAEFSAFRTCTYKRNPAQATVNRVIEKMRETARLVSKTLLCGAATLTVSGIFLAGSWLFFIQLAEYGW